MATNDAPTSGGITITDATRDPTGRFKVAGYVTGEWMPDKVYPVELFGATWNGWEVPHVTEDTARMIVEDQASVDGDNLALVECDRCKQLVIAHTYNDGAVELVHPTLGDRSLIYNVSFGWTWERWVPDVLPSWLANGVLNWRENVNDPNDRLGMVIPATIGSGDSVQVAAGYLDNGTPIAEFGTGGPIALTAHNDRAESTTVWLTTSDALRLIETLAQTVRGVMAREKAKG